MELNVAKDAGACPLANGDTMDTASDMQIPVLDTGNEVSVHSLSLNRLRGGGLRVEEFIWRNQVRDHCRIQLRLGLAFRIQFRTG